MDITEIDEKWVEIPKVRKTRGKDSIVAISNTGNYRRADGTEGILKLRQSVKYHGEKRLCYRVIAENFLITVKRPDQHCIDHITHHPDEYNLNNVLNLRWCTDAENNGFEEARENMSKGMKGVLKGEKNPSWKGDDVEAAGAYVRHLKLYKAGEITEEELQPYRDGWAEYRRQRKIAKKTSSES